MIKFRRLRILQKFVSTYSSVHNHFNHERQETNRETFKLQRMPHWPGGSTLARHNAGTFVPFSLYGDEVALV